MKWEVRNKKWSE